MAKVNGTVRKVQSDQEGKGVVLRFKFCTDRGELIPAEMRGHQIYGQLGPGDRIVINNCKRDKYGVMHPKVVNNLTTNSLVRVIRPGLFSKIISFLFSTLFSIATGIITNRIVNYYSEGSRKINPDYSIPRSDGINIPPPAVLISIAVSLIVFYFIYIRRRHR